MPLCLLIGRAAWVCVDPSHAFKFRRRNLHVIRSMLEVIAVSKCQTKSQDRSGGVRLVLRKCIQRHGLYYWKSRHVCAYEDPHALPDSFKSIHLYL